MTMRMVRGDAEGLECDICRMLITAQQSGMHFEVTPTYGQKFERGKAMYDVHWTCLTEAEIRRVFDYSGKITNYGMMRS